MKPTAYIKDDFKNLLDYQGWLNKSFDNLTSKNTAHIPNYGRPYIEHRIREDQDWFGASVTYKELKEGVKEYQDPELLDKVYQKVSDVIERTLSQHLKARKMKFNALGFGMFCFDRASMTLYRNKEYYSSSQKKTVDKADVKVSGKGYVLKADQSKVTERWEQKADGKAKVRTHTKELFAYFPEVKRDKHAVEFFISCDAPGSAKANEMLYGGISAVIMAELLMKAGIKVKINTVLGSALDSKRSEYIGSVIPIKHYDEPLDRNIVALMSSDPRFMRYDAFKGVIASFDHFNRATPFGLGLPMNAAQLKTLFEDSGYTQKSQAAHRYYFGGTLSESAAILDIEKTISDIAKHLKP